MMEWISSHKVQDHIHLQGDYAVMEEGMFILQEWKKIHAPPGCPLPLPYPSWRARGNYAVCNPHGSYSGGHEQVPYGCWTSRPKVNPVPIARLVLMALVWQCKGRRQSVAVKDVSNMRCPKLRLLLQAILATSPLELLHAALRWQWN